MCISDRSQSQKVRPHLPARTVKLLKCASEQLSVRPGMTVSAPCGVCLHVAYNTLSMLSCEAWWMFLDSAEQILLFFNSGLEKTVKLTHTHTHTHTGFYIPSRTTKHLPTCFPRDTLQSFVHCGCIQICDNCSAANEWTNSANEII